MNLYDDVTGRLKNSRISALVIEEVMESVKGPLGAVSPPTYAGGDKGVPYFASTDDAFIPTKAANGWYQALAEKDGGPRLGKRVVINALAACADSAETGLYRNQERLSLRLPAIVVDANTVSETRIDEAVKKAKKSPQDATHAEQIRQALTFRFPSWELAHRTADSWLMFAQESGSDEQVWATSGAVKNVLLNIGYGHGDNVYAHAPNAAIFGAWLSSGTARRQAVARAYSCEITGFGVTDAARGATKLDRTGGTTKSARKLTAGPNGVTLGDKGKEPSELGFGQVPNGPATRGFVCELILRQAALSLRALDRFVYEDDATLEKAFAAKRVYTLLAMAGHLLAQEDGFLRSECDLVSVEEHWGWRVHGTRAPEVITPPTLDEVREALAQAVSAAEVVGLRFAEPIELTLSDAQIGLIVDRVLEEGAPGAKTEAGR